MARIGTVLIAAGEIRIDDPRLEAQIATLAKLNKMTANAALVKVFKYELSQAADVAD